MESSSSNLTSYRWTIADFMSQWDKACAENERTMLSENFALNTCPSVSFALYIDTKLGSDEKDSFGVVLKNLGKLDQVKASAKLWVESIEGEKFGETSVQKHIFSNVGDKLGFNGLSADEFTEFFDLYEENKDFIFCCELTDLNLRFSELERLQSFNQNQWSLFEHEVHDAIIKVNETEFKVLKAFFIAQSDVFQTMFNSGFNEGQTSVIEIKDIHEDIVKHFIKWIYTGQIEDKGKVENLFETADKYNVKLLKKTCFMIMIDNLNKDNAVQRLILAVMHHEEILKDAALDVIAQMSGAEVGKFLTSPEWFEFHSKSPDLFNEVVKSIHEKFSV